MNYKKVLILLGIMVVIGAILAACSGNATTTQAPATDAPAAADVTVPYLEDWQGSGHNDVAGEPFRHWDDATENPDGVPTTCAKCHTSAGYQDYLGLDGSEAGKVDAAVPAAQTQGIQ